VLQTDGPPAPETLRRDQLARRERIVRTALHALAGSDYNQVKVSDAARGGPYTSAAAQFRDVVQTAFSGPSDANHDAVFTTVNAVLGGSLRAWVMNRATAGDVYGNVNVNVDQAIRLIYQYCPR
jgi:hypothetical protein